MAMAIADGKGTLGGQESGVAWTTLRSSLREVEASSASMLAVGAAFGASPSAASLPHITSLTSGSGYFGTVASWRRSMYSKFGVFSSAFVHKSTV